MTREQTPDIERFRGSLKFEVFANIQPGAMVTNVRRILRDMKYHEGGHTGQPASSLQEILHSVHL